VQSCPGFGISSGFSSIIESCTANRGGGTGIAVADHSVVSRCTSQLNEGHGIYTQGQSTIVDCTAAQNRSGIRVLGDSVVSRCTVSYNSEDGITFLGIGGIIADCSSSFNDRHGISISGNTCVRDNTCAVNGFGSGNGSNIHVEGTDNRIEGNTCTAADVGFEILGTGNLIIRNSCSGNSTNWAFVPNNVHGPIIDRTAPGSPAVTGNAAASSLGTTDSNANLTY
jgi:parallel beta-helix repeat protein